MNTDTHTILPKRLKLVAWLNIAIQVSFPIVSVFTPIISSSQDNIRFLKKENALIDRQTQTYTLSEGENILYVAKKYNMSVDALRELNQFRTFAHGFDKLQAGDELDVPMAALPTIEWHAKTEPETSQNNQEQHIANLASQAGQFLSNNPNKDTAVALARGMASAAANNYLQQWVNHIGNSRIQLDIDEHFALQNSQADLLVPLYDKKEKLLFTQGSLHRTDERTQTNLGLGIRWFQPDYMLGANSFLDYDLSRNHSRIGFGVEYRRDYLKLAANSYHRLSNWQDSKDLEDYQERTANGWDIRSEAWLPSYPHVGAKLSYEQYYGDEVGLFGSDKRGTNPQAVTAGLSYTPFPLFTINAEQRQGTSGEHDSRIGLQVNYQLGTAWQQQINPDNVSALRTLQGSRYDFVDRNNNIVLEYRKKEVISLSINSPITGYAGEEKPLTFTVNSKYGLDHIEWSAPQLIGANGQLIDNKKGEYRVRLPDYQYNKKAVNSYIINAVAIDKKGNRSANTTLQVTVNQAAIYPANTQVSPTKFSLAANGKAQQKITFIIKDKNNQLVDVATNEISLKITSIRPKRIRELMRKSPSSPVTLSEVTRIESGKYSVMVTAGKNPEQVTLTPVVRNTLLTPIDVTLTADSQTPHLTQITVSKNNSVANGKDENHVILVLKDAQNHLLIGHPVKFTATNKAKVPSQQETNEQGEISVPITSTTAGEAVLSIHYGNAAPKTVAMNFTADSTTAKVAIKEGVTIAPDKSVADGTTTKKITIKVTDAHNNAVPNVSVQLKTNNGQFANGKPVDNALITNNNGIAQTTLTSKIAGLADITVTVNGKTYTQKTLFTSDTTSARIKLKVTSPTLAVANGKQPIEVMAILTDSNHNPLPNTAVTWLADPASGVTFDSQTKTDNQGKTVLLVTSTFAGDIKLTAKTANATDQSLTVTFSADKSTAKIDTANLKITPPNVIADGKSQKTITATVSDAHGNIVPKVNVLFTTTGSGQFVGSKTDKSTIAQTEKNGTATVKLTNTKAEIITVSANVNGNTVDQVTAFLADMTSPKITKLQAKNNHAVADGNAAITFEAYVKDTHGNPIENAIINWSSDHNERDVRMTNTVTKTDKQGIATTAVKSFKAADIIVSASVTGKKTPANPVTFIADKTTAQLAPFDTLPTTIIANGTEKVAIKTRVTDQNGNPVNGIDVNFSANNKAKMFPQTVTSDKDGYVKSDLTTNNIADKITITANINHKTAITSTITSIADIKTATIKLQPVSAKIPASNLGVTSGIKLKAIVKDAKGHLLEGIPVIWSTDFNQFDNDTTQTNAQGETSVTLYGTKAGKTAVTASLLNKASSKEEVTFTAGAANDTNSVLKMSQDSILANGLNISMAQLTLKDMWGNPVTGQTIKWSRSNSEVTIKDKGEIDSSGVYQAEVTSNKAGIHPISATINGITKQEKIGAIADISTAMIESINIDGSNTAAANGSAKIKVVVKIKDTATNPVQDAIIGWNTTLGKLSSPTSKADRNGEAEIILTSTEAGKAIVTAQIGGSKQTISSLEFTAGTVSAKKSTATLSASMINAGSGETLLTVEAKDEQGNPLTNLARKIQPSVPAGLITIKSAFKETKLGTYEAKLSATAAKTTQLSIQIDGRKINEEPTLTIQPDSKTAQVKGQIKVSSTSAVAGKDVTYSLELEDKYGNPLKAGEVIFWSANDGTHLSNNQTLTDANGKSHISVVRSNVGDANVVIKLGSNAGYRKDAPIVSFTQAEIDTTKSTVRLAKSTINAGEETLLTVTLKDKYGNLLNNLASDIHVNSTHPNILITPAAAKSTGIYEMKVTSNKLTTAEISINVLGNALVEKENITVKGDPNSWKISKVEPNNTILKAGDKTGVTYSATVVDQFDNILPYVTVSWHIDGKVEKYDFATTTNASGVAEVTVTSNTIGELVMTATLTKGNSLTANKVTVIQGDMNATNSILTSDKKEIGADSTEIMTLTVKAVDDFNNPIIGGKVTIESNSPNFMIGSPLIDNNDGSYQTTATSNKQGIYTLTAKVNGKPLSKTLMVKSGAANPVLRFDNTQRSLVYSSTVDRGQILKGLPTGAIATWESSNTSIATVNSDGAVKLLKAGNVKITARIQGNGVYNSAQASYELNIDKADPQLQIPNRVINETWGDSRGTVARAVFNNPDTNSAKPAITFSIDNTNIATIDKNNGVITQKKPNSKTATITVESEETEQFKAAKQQIFYQLGKSRFTVAFSNSIEKMTDNIHTFNLQKTTQKIPNYADIVWTSGNESAIKLKPNGSIERLQAGQASLTMKVNSNDYFEESSHSYTAKIYTKPNVTINSIDYGNNGDNVTHADKWAPVYTDDKVKVSWSSKSNSEFDKAKKVIINFKVDGSTKYSQTYDKFTGNIVTEFSPNKEYINKKLNIEFIAESDTDFNIPRKEVSIVPILGTAPADIGTIKTTTVTGYFNQGVVGFPEESRCKSNHFENQRYAIIFPVIEISYNHKGKSLLQDISVESTIYSSKYSGSSSRSNDIHYPKIEQPDANNKYQYAWSELKKYKAYEIKNDCWTSHKGKGKVDTTLDFLGTTTHKEFDFSWSGDP
ncbi:Ig-like domain-containing protein [Providencia manganoxydans]|uniref:Ig-like domain-containing protein n=1 Tax=Providencia manganoxydans TaxID=2923283 RepID=UPI0034DCE512